MHQEINHAKKWKYAHQEIERRFLLSEQPKGLQDCPFKQIEDKYLKGSRLRLRKTVQNGQSQYKLSKKLSLDDLDKARQWCSTIYLSEQEYLLFSQLPGNWIKKRRYYYPSKHMEIGIDEIELPAGMLWIVELEFEEDESFEISLPFKEYQEITGVKEYLGSEIAKQYQMH